MLKMKLIRDILSNKVQFVSIFLMAALSTYIFVGMASVWYGLEHARDEYYNKTNYADYILTSVAGFSESDIDSIEQIDGVVDVSSRYTIEDCIAVNENNASLILHVLDSNKLSKCVVIKGDEFDTYKDGVWLDYRYAKENSLTVGDCISIKIGQAELIREIKGVVINPEYIYQVNKDSIIPTHKEMGFAYVSKYSLEELSLEGYPNEVLIKMKDSKELKLD